MRVKKDDIERHLLAIFLTDIKKYPVLSREDEYLIAKQAQMGDEEAFKVLIASNLRFVLMIAFRFARLGYPLLDLISAGCLGLMQAAALYDPDRGVRFLTYAVYPIRHRIIEFIKDCRHHELLSLDEPIFEEEDEATLKDTLISESTSPEESHFNYEVRTLLQNLNERENSVINLRFWKDKTLDEIGALIGFSKARAGQIETRALRKMRWAIYQESRRSEWCNETKREGAITTI